ncbi:SAM-dependent methyltransferase [Bordetella holmesii]|nr:class I SAM-dependent methyltransferase [Bordetella holmesii]EWM49066.1 methyltransferase domain protein [Bordetella holmesii 70147]UEB19351.1 class I SAM-dependent methyltransferase [Bordetella holmesii]SUV93433.1 Methyltransferase domain [Bordetella holmesii]
MTRDLRNLSHGQHRSRTDLEARLAELGDLPGWPVSRQVALLRDVANCQLGEFLLTHGGLDAHWTDVVVGRQPGTGEATERMLLQRLPAAAATRARFEIFTRQLQHALRPGMALVSLPCGTLTDLLSLDFSQARPARLIGIDIDDAALATAARRAAELGMDVELRQEDAWRCRLDVAADIVVSHGLSIYEPDDDRVRELYRRCAAMLKPTGLLVTSFMTPPPSLSPDSPWRMDILNPDDLMLQQVLFTRLLQPAWTGLRSHARTRALLQDAGLDEIVFHDDPAALFPTVTARRCG